MKLVKVENYRVVFDDEFLLLKPFRNLYEKDNSENKEKFMDFLTIIYYVYDPRSDYAYIIDEEMRLEEVCKSNGIHCPKITKDRQDCIDLYKQLTTTSSQELLKSTRQAIDKIRKFLETVDLDTKDDHGKPVYTINSITSAIKLIPQLAKDVVEAEKVVTKEIEEAGRARGGRESKSLMEDGVFEY